MSITSSSNHGRALTICSVSFHNARHLILNWNLTHQCNRDPDRIKWVIAENTPEGTTDRLSITDERFQVLPGTSGQRRVSYHHTEALQKCLAAVDTRFLLVLDPDFYIVRGQWLDEIITHMQTQNLALFGVPWHPKYIDKFRYFPTVHCTFVDLEKIGIEALDFRPWGADEIEPTHDNSATGTHAIEVLWRALRLQHRRKEYRDSGTRMYFRYALDAAINYECPTPVYRLPQDFIGSGNPLSLRSRLIEHLLPDSLCYLPKRRDSYTNIGFREQGFGCEFPAFWEEFMWKGIPFGFHVRRNAKKQVRDEDTELRAIEQFIESIRITL